MQKAASSANDAISPRTGFEARRESRREAILDVARECFLNDGYAATSMSKIAGKLGGSKGTLYNYFSRKEDLFAAMMRRECVNQALPLFELPAVDTVEATLYQLGRGFVDLVLSDTILTIQRLIIAEGRRFPDLGRIFFENGPGLVGERLVTLFCDLMTKGALQGGEPKAAAAHFRDLVLSSRALMQLWGVAAPPTPEDLDEQVRNAVTVFLRAYPEKVCGGPRT